MAMGSRAGLSPKAARHIDIQELRGVAAGTRYHSLPKDLPPEQAPERRLYLRRIAAEHAAAVVNANERASVAPGASHVESLETGVWRDDRRIELPLAEAPILGGMASSWQAPMSQRGPVARTERQEMRAALADARMRLGVRLEPPDSPPPPDLDEALGVLRQPPLSCREPRRLEASRQRHEAARVVGTCHLDDPTHRHALVAALDDPEHDVRLAAAKGLTRSSPDGLKEHVDVLVDASRDRCRSVYCKGPPPSATGPMLGAPQDSEWEVREASIRALGRLSPTSSLDAVEAVTRALHDRSPAVRAAASDALRNWGPAVAKHLLALLETSPNPRTRRSAACALNTWGVAGSSAVEASAHRSVAVALKDNKREVREAAVQAMEGTSCPRHALASQSARVEAAHAPPHHLASTLLWTQGASDRFLPAGVPNHAPWSWSARIKRVRAQRCGWE
eukprot:CAMPEP_0203951332 /NCGR_PEP_ID=MMETSP0359-20131031/85255_1 /ASSEMBLY_ACC=CAM_ASM_000338 /TAXON_ID=268821 /ORGANISM="Scrippsiella Hangoei, Strain SHTV-5" /LENGTH=448 /DNA_ID=CAMNT_0050883903 /DNA_START=38 /DNA_END=1381 /DNA_ORIENTATION=+